MDNGQILQAITDYIEHCFLITGFPSIEDKEDLIQYVLEMVNGVDRQEVETYVIKILKNMSDIK